MSYAGFDENIAYQMNLHFKNSFNIIPQIEMFNKNIKTGILEPSNDNKTAYDRTSLSRAGDNNFYK